MRIGVVGLGSMGSRRVRDLSALGHEVVGYDIDAARGEQASSRFGVRTFGSFEELKKAGAEAIVISTPPDQHVGYYEACFRSQLPFFSEANIFTPRASWFCEQAAKAGVTGYPSATWQFYPLFGTLKDVIAGLGDRSVQTVHYHYGGFLPYWHPEERYDHYYAGRPLTSAAREMVPFEMEWLCWIFGPVKAVCAVRDRRHDWVTDIDDSYFLMLDFESGLRGSLIVELHQVAPFRIGRVSCTNDAFTVEMATHELLWFSKATDSWRRMKPAGMRTLGSFDFEEIYRAEIAAFTDALENGGAYVKSWADDRHLSNILFAAEESWGRKEWVSIEEAESLYDGMTLEHGVNRVAQ
jgi:predicted dehydrogenase